MSISVFLSKEKINGGKAKRKELRKVKSKYDDLNLIFFFKLDLSRACKL